MPFARTGRMDMERVRTVHVHYSHFVRNSRDRSWVKNYIDIAASYPSL